VFTHIGYGFGVADLEWRTLGNRPTGGRGVADLEWRTLGNRPTGGRGVADLG